MRNEAFCNCICTSLTANFTNACVYELTIKTLDIGQELQITRVVTLNIYEKSKLPIM